MLSSYVQCPCAHPSFWLFMFILLSIWVFEYLLICSSSWSVSTYLLHNSAHNHSESHSPSNVYTVSRHSSVGTYLYTYPCYHKGLPRGKFISRLNTCPHHTSIDCLLMSTDMGVLVKESGWLLCELSAVAVFNCDLLSNNHSLQYTAWF